MTLRALLATLAVLLPIAAFAHGGGAGPHGGLTEDAGPYFVELLAEAGQIKVFVFNEKTEKPESAKAAKATATVLVGQQRETVTLQPDASDKNDNLMTGKLTLPPGKGMRVVVQLQMPGQPTVVARFAY